ncbi:hypothetical protein VC83_08021 [Pseudogymnoascus destructans]|uniref:DUF7924 domain-containing protein n=2 Tax=Pseudogymnoascus destructans TaxID=655981 RepID=L8G526_PSED2|nr:uncharacterized protein VC83_08021 [Pseudogymnoascus destructans]ELR08217.1 hypothetical protein GMDG_03027 [Pseudogymnoascus destructans 20631-21]OAF55946.1 hypothetical protein VC83_08021 [Pseudogymnoascus destructans]
MAPREAKPNVQKVGRKSSAPKDHGKRPQGIEKRPHRKSARLKNPERRQERTIPGDTNTHGALFPRVKENSLEPLKAENRKRRRPQESESPLSGALSNSARKRPRTSVTSSVIGDKSIKQSPKRTRTSPRQLAIEDTSIGSTPTGVEVKEINPIEFWTRKQRWPKELFQQDDQAREDLEKDSWYEKYWVPEMNHLLARKKSSSSLRRKQLNAGSVTASSATPSDQKPREVKSAPYQDGRYQTILASQGSFMSKSELGSTDASKSLCQTLLENEQTVPQESLFRDDLFEKACEKIQNRNEARVVQDIARLIVPSAETLATLGSKHLESLVESVNEGWNNSIPITQIRPQPDYAVGFGREAFTEDQLKRLEPFVGELTDTSYFMATYYMYFPFLTCEVKCGAAALDVADRQNAHSMTMAVRGIVELFRLVKREKELHREILAFSLSHDHRTVRIYGHYPIISGDKTTFYRHPIHTFDFTSLDGKEKWTAYRFTKNVYDIWMPTHLKRICSVIDELPPDLDFEVSQQSDLGGSGLSQGLQSHHLSRKSSYGAVSLQEEAESQPSRTPSRDITPDTSLSQGIDKAFKKPKKRGRAVELHQ